MPQSTYLHHFKSLVQAFFPALKTVLISAYIDEPFADTDMSATARYQLIISAESQPTCSVTVLKDTSVSKT